MFEVAAIIPCAGYGTRMGMSSSEAKELLYLNGENVPCINYSLDLCNKYNLKPVVISRPEKKEFNKYIEDWGGCTLLMHTPAKGEEWPDTVLASLSEWEYKNVLILPDTRFTPTEAVYQIVENLAYHSVDAATHSVSDGSKWGTLSIEEDGYSTILEKPKNTTHALAWGLLGWRKDEGRMLFEGISKEKKYSQYYINNIPLTSFKDITRSSTIEEDVENFKKS